MSKYVPINEIQIPTRPFFSAGMTDAERNALGAQYLAVAARFLEEAVGCLAYGDGIPVAQWATLNRKAQHLRTDAESITRRIAKAQKGTL